MLDVPTSDPRRRPVTPRYDYVVKSSCGNDSLALTNWLYLHLKRTGERAQVVVVYNNTGWASAGWPERVARAKVWVESLGFDFVELASVGMVECVTGRGAGMPPQQAKAYCSVALKIEPTEDWLDSWDPECDSIGLIGKRRLESRYRRSTPKEVTGVGPLDWRNMCSDGEPRTTVELRRVRKDVLDEIPEYRKLFDKQGDQAALAAARKAARKDLEDQGALVRRCNREEKLGARLSQRDIMHPLYMHDAAMRDELLPREFPSYAQVCAALALPMPTRCPTPELQAAVEEYCHRNGMVIPYLTRSEECQPCLPYGNKLDFATLPPERQAQLSSTLVQIRKRYPKFTYRPARKSGGATEVSQLVEWGRSSRGKYDEAQTTFCDMGWCGT